MIGKSLIVSVGIQKVYYGLSHQDLGELKNREQGSDPEYIQIGRDGALEMFKSWEAQDEKIAD